MPAMPASLPETAEEDILSRLPVKTIMQYKCVCKPWYSLFHSPYFIKMQRDRGIDNTFLMLHYWCGSNDSAALYSIECNSLSSKLSSETCSTPPLAEAVKMDYPLVPPNYFLLSGSYDGLLCLQTGMLPGSSAEAIFLWNPSTMEYKKIPDSPNKLVYGERDVSLCGLGYDSKIEDFKIVKVRFVDYYPSSDYSSSDSDDYSSGGWQSSGSNYNYEVYEAEKSSHFSLENAEMEVSHGSEAQVSRACSWPWKPPYAGISEFEVYTLGTNSWKTCKTMPYYFPNGLKSGVVVNGDLHWWAVKIQDGYEAIISFDMTNEVFKEVTVLDGPLLHPGNCDKRTHDNVLGALGGCICLLHRSYGVKVDVWVMEEYGVKESWTNRFTITQGSLTVTHGLRLVCDFENGGILFKTDHFFVYYDPNHNTEKTLEIDGGVDHILGAEKYVSSLVSLNSGTYVKKRQIKRKFKSPMTAYEEPIDQEK